MKYFNMMQIVNIIVRNFDIVTLLSICELNCELDNFYWAASVCFFASVFVCFQIIGIETNKLLEIPNLLFNWKYKWSIIYVMNCNIAWCFWKYFALRTSYSCIWVEIDIMSHDYWLFCIKWFLNLKAMLIYTFIGCHLFDKKKGLPFKCWWWEFNLDV